MRATSFVFWSLVLTGLLGLGAGQTSAQFQIAPVPGGGYAGPGAFGPAGGYGGYDGGLGTPGLGNGIDLLSGLDGASLGGSSFNQERYGCPDFHVPAESASGGPPPPPDEPRWDVPHVTAPPSDQNREETLTSSSLKDAPNTSVKSAHATTKQPSGWRWKWWHGVVVLVILGLVMAAGKK
jgi:hypothetical protein